MYAKESPENIFNYPKRFPRESKNFSNQKRMTTRNKNKNGNRITAKAKKGRSQSKWKNRGSDK